MCSVWSSECLSYSWDTSTNQCSLWTTSVSQANPNGDLGNSTTIWNDAKCPSPAPPTRYCNYPALNAPPYAGFMANFVEPFQRDCHYVCQNTPGCQSYVFYAEIQQCQLMSSTITELNPQYMPLGNLFWSDVSCPVPPWPDTPVCYYQAENNPPWLGFASNAWNVTTFAGCSEFCSISEIMVRIPCVSFMFDASIGQCQMMRDSVIDLAPPVSLNQGPLSTMWFDLSCVGYPTCGLWANTATNYSISSSIQTFQHECADACRLLPECQSYSFVGDSCILYSADISVVNPSSSADIIQAQYFQKECG
jgi:PAN domain